MKKILTVAIACACLTGFSACNDFLEEKPKSSLTAPDYYQTEAQAQANVNFCIVRELQVSSQVRVVLT
jgi:hypothetical protein